MTTAVNVNPEGSDPRAVLLATTVAPGHAPAVLRVNANFDEQKVDSLIGALPDNADESLIIANGPRAGWITVNDLFPGFFGPNPAAGNPYDYAGGTVTIKKLPNIDPDTGQPEPGEVRFYVTQDLGTTSEYYWPVAITDGDGAPVNLVGVLYGPWASLPSGAGVQYWMEGVKPGPITLEFKFLNANGVTISTYQQTFLVCTQQSKAAWQEEIRQQILLETSGNVDMANYISPAGSGTLFTSNWAFMDSVFTWYERTYFKKPEGFLWPGMAKLVGAPLAMAMVETESARYTLPTLLGGLGWILGDALADGVEIGFLHGNKAIFADIPWQFRAYQTSGIWALRYCVKTHTDLPALRALDIRLWENFYNAERTGNVIAMHLQMKALIQREQQYIAQPAWDEIHAKIPNFILNILAQNPIPGGYPFNEVSSGDISDYRDRMDWVDDPVKGMWQSFMNMGRAARDSEITIPLLDRAINFL